MEVDYDEAVSLRKTIEAKKKPRKKYRNSNHFLRTHISYSFPLTGMPCKETIDRALQQSITGEEGFFAISKKRIQTTDHS